MAYGGPGQTTPGKSNSTTSLSTGSDRERERESKESLHFTEKAFVSSEYFTEMKEWEAADCEFLSLRRLRMKDGEREGENRGGNEGWVLAFALLLSLFLSCGPAAYHTNMFKWKSGTYSHSDPFFTGWKNMRENCYSGSFFHLSVHLFLIFQLLKWLILPRNPSFTHIFHHSIHFFINPPFASVSFINSIPDSFTCSFSHWHFHLHVHSLFIYALAHSVIHSLAAWDPAPTSLSSSLTLIS